MTGTTSLDRHKTILVTGGVFRVFFANWIPCLPPSLYDVYGTGKSHTRLARFPSLGIQSQ